MLSWTRENTMGNKMFDSTPTLPQRSLWHGPQRFSTSTQWGPTNICLNLLSPSRFSWRENFIHRYYLVRFCVSSIVFMQSRLGAKQRYSQHLHLFWANIFPNSFSLQVFVGVFLFLLRFFGCHFVLVFLDTFSLSIHPLPLGTIMHSVLRVCQ